ncbi:MAG: asparaginase [Deltaproteobacteria bacterium]|nr:asparaginase [Deltaproteobacteria bacterium]
MIPFDTYPRSRHIPSYEVIRIHDSLRKGSSANGRRQKKDMSKLPRVALIITGGTIDSVGTDRLDLAWYIEAGKRLNTGELLAQLPELESIARVEEFPFRRLPSHALVDKDWLDLVRTIHSIFDDDRADGIVITHGTNTIEETAYFLNLTLKTDRPVVIVGAMRPSSALSADGYLNLLNAARVAGDPSSRGRGALLAMNDTIYSGRDVTKTATYRVQAFQGRDLGPLGYSDADGKVVYYHQSVKPHTVNTEFDVRDRQSLPRVDVVVSYVGADGAMIDAAVAAGARGIISAGTGAGRPTPAEDEAFNRASKKGVIICIGTRVGSGRVVRSPGLVRRGFVASDNLQPWKARVLLALALTKTSDPDEIQRCFNTY